MGRMEANPTIGRQQPRRASEPGQRAGGGALKGVGDDCRKSLQPNGLPDLKARQEQPAVAVEKDDSRRMHESYIGNGLIVPGRQFSVNQDDGRPPFVPGIAEMLAASDKLVKPRTMARPNIQVSTTRMCPRPTLG